MPSPLKLLPTENILVEYITGWNATFSDAYPPDVTLTALIQSSLPYTLPPTPEQTATTLVIPMDARAASILYEKLGNLGRSMGWLPQIGGATQDERH